MNIRFLIAPLFMLSFLTHAEILSNELIESLNLSTPRNPFCGDITNVKSASWDITKYDQMQGGGTSNVKGSDRADAESASKSCINDKKRLGNAPARPINSISTSARKNALNAGVEAEAFDNAISYYMKNRTNVKNRKYMVINDLSMKSDSEHFFVINLQTGQVEKYRSQFGSGSDTDDQRDGYIDRISKRPCKLKTSNEGESSMSSEGFFLTGGTYYGKWGRSLRLHGMEDQLNSNACWRQIVVHGHPEIGPGNMWRSLGCPAVAKNKVQGIIEKIKDGAVFYNYSGGESC